MITPEELAKLYRAVGLTKEDVYDAEGTHVDPDGVVRKGNFTDRVIMLRMQKGTPMLLLPQMQRSNIRMEWMVILDADQEFPEGEEFWYAVRDAMDTCEAINPYPELDGKISHMTLDEYMDFLDAHPTREGYAGFDSREDILNYRRANYRAARQAGLDEGQTFSEFVGDDHWIGPVRDEDYREPINGDIMSDDNESLDVSETE